MNDVPDDKQIETELELRARIRMLDMQKRYIDYDKQRRYLMIIHYIMQSIIAIGAVSIPIFIATPEIPRIVPTLVSSLVACLMESSQTGWTLFSLL